MKTYLVRASYVTYLNTLVTADSLEEAQQIADCLDGAEFQAQASDDWAIDAVTEI